MKLGIRSRLYGGFAVLVALSGGMGGFAYYQLSVLDETFDERGRIERAARELYTVNGLTDRFVGQSAQFRATYVQDQVGGMNASLDSIKQIADGLVERALSEERRAAYAKVRSETMALTSDLPKLIDLGNSIRDNKLKLFAAGDNLTKATNALVAQIRAGGDADGVVAAAAVESAVLLVRVTAWRFLATNDANGLTTFTTNVDKTRAAMPKLRTLNITAAQTRAVQAIEEALDGYEAIFGTMSSTIVRTEEFYTKDIKPRVELINATGLGVRTKLEATLHGLIERSNATMLTAETVQLGMVGLIMLLGAGIAFWIARGIIRPISATARSMTGVADNTNHQALASSAAAEETSANVQTVASAAEEMVASLQEIERQVHRSNEGAGTAAREADATTLSMTRLAEAAEKIGDAVTMISNIAGQTNLLALNATIEAARAGEAGRGFAVVATEVKELAGQTARATHEISGQIASIQTASSQALAAIQQIGRTIVTVNEITGTIAATVVEQTSATNEIARNASEAARGTQDVSANVAHVLASSGETGSAAQQVLGAAAELATQSLSVKRDVDDFLAAIRAA